MQKEQWTSSFVKLIIYNTQGQVVKILENSYQSAGEFSHVWNSKDALGNNVSSGLFIYRIQAGNFIEQKKMILLR